MGTEIDIRGEDSAFARTHTTRAGEWQVPPAPPEVDLLRRLSYVACLREARLGPRGALCS